MEPTRDKFSLSPQVGLRNWELALTYPAAKESKEGDITYMGLFIINSEQALVGDRLMMSFTTPVKHGLSQGEKVKLTGLLTNNGTYTVVRLGKSNGDYQEYVFTVDITEEIVLGDNPRMIRIYDGRQSTYYFRKFKKITSKLDSEGATNNDYEIFPLAFSQNVFEDNNNHFVINEDVDIAGLVDCHKRPLSELYITLIKTDSNNTFTQIKSGLDMPYITGALGNTTLPNIRLITNSSVSNEELDSDVKITDDTFYGDVAEYNFLELKEKVLGEVRHRFNTKNRISTSTLLNDTDFNDTKVDLGIRYEGYLYKPHHKIKIRDFSSYVEQGNSNTLNMPNYKAPLDGGRYLWRDLLDIGTNDAKESTVDYPFLNGAHYINSEILFKVRRQDPFGLYGLQYTGFPADRPGNMIDDNIIIKESQDVC